MESGETDDAQRLLVSSHRSGRGAACPGWVGSRARPRLEDHADVAVVRVRLGGEKHYGAASFDRGVLHELRVV